MGTLTLLEFRTELLFDLKNRTDTTTTDGLSDTRLNLFINSAYWHLSHPSVFRHRELQSGLTIALANGTNSYTFSPIGGIIMTGIRSVTHVAAAFEDPTARHTKLLPHDEQWFLARTLNSSGVPRDYMTRGDLLFISPVPGANEVGTVLVISAWFQPIPLAGDGSITVIDSRFDEILLLAARWRAELHLGYRDLAEATKLDWVSLLNEYKTHEDLQGEDWDWKTDLVSESVMERA